MGNGLFKRVWNKRTVRVLVLGLYESGKSTALLRLQLGDVSKLMPTSSEYDVETVEHKNVQIMTWDVGGRAKVRPLLRHYFADTQGIVFVIDSSNIERFDDAIVELKKTLAEEELKGVPILILANKQDLPYAISVDKIQDSLQGIELAESRSWAIFGTNATSVDVTGTGLYLALGWLVDAMVSKERSHMIEEWIPITSHVSKPSTKYNYNKNSNVLERCIYSVKTFLSRVS